MKSTDIRIADGVALPPDLSTQSITILAKRRVGKSYTMRRIWEQLLKSGQHVVVVDPKGDQWGIRSSADGKRPGFPVLILGGEHGDLPLEKSGGELIAKVVAEQQVNVLIDTSHFSKTARAEFMAHFLENLYRLKAQEKYRTPLCVIIDEADEIAPQRPQKGEERMLGAIDDIVRRGGQRGLGSILVTQRSASLNKNVLTQSEMLILLRTIAPHDLAAVQAWIDVHGTPEQKKLIMEELPSLPVGEAYFWSPAWPVDGGMFIRAHVLAIETFDSAKTPEVGKKRVVPKNMADVDLDALRGQMAETIEKKKKEDPGLLRKEIARLTAELGRKGQQKDSVKDTSRTIQRQIEYRIDPRREKEWENILRQANKEIVRLVEAFGKIQKFANGLDVRTTVFAAPKKQEASVGVRPDIAHEELEPLSARSRHKVAPVHTDALPADASLDITDQEQRILDGIAWMESIGIKRPKNAIVAFLARYTNPRSTGYTNPRGYLKGKELIDYPGDGTVELTDTGRALAHWPSEIGSQEEMHRRILERLTGPQAKILKVLLDACGEPMANEAIAEAAGYSNVRSTGYTNPRGDLHQFELIEYTNDGPKAADFLFVAV